MSAPPSSAAPPQGGLALSVVIPAYQAAEVLARNLPLLLDHLAQLGLTYEVIIADDGSPDEGRTAQVAARLGCRYVRLPENRGKGAAVRLGMRAARGRFHLFTDADIPYELGAIERFVHYLDDKGFDFVAGDRTLPGAHYYADISLLRRLSSRVFAFTVGSLIAASWFDTQCGIKGFRAEVSRDLFSSARIDGFAFDVELFHIALLRNYDIKRVPVRLRSQDTSSVQLMRDGLRMLRELMQIRLNDLRGYYDAP